MKAVSLQYALLVLAGSLVASNNASHLRRNDVQQSVHVNERRNESNQGGKKLFLRALKTGGSKKGRTEEDGPKKGGGKEKRERPDKGEKPEKRQKPEKGEKPEKRQKPEKGDKPERRQKPEKGGKPEKRQKPENPQKTPRTKGGPKPTKQEKEKPTKRAHKVGPIDPEVGVPGGGAPQGMIVKPNNEGKVGHVKHGPKKEESPPRKD